MSETNHRKIIGGIQARIGLAMLKLRLLIIFPAHRVFRHTGIDVTKISD